MASAAHAQSAYTTLPQENRTRFDAWFSRFDANSDGQITHDEYMYAQEQRFRAADMNGDGQLTTRTDEHTPELQSTLRNSDAVFCLQNQNRTQHHPQSSG